MVNVKDYSELKATESNNERSTIILDVEKIPEAERKRIYSTLAEDTGAPVLGLKIGSVVLRKSSKGLWEEYIISDLDALNNARDFPDQYRPITGYMYDEEGTAYPYTIDIMAASPKEKEYIIIASCYITDSHAIHYTATGVIKKIYQDAIRFLSNEVSKL